MTKEMTHPECVEILKEILEESMKARGVLLNILDTDKMPKFQTLIKEDELKTRNEGLSHAIQHLSKKEVSVGEIAEILSIVFNAKFAGCSKPEAFEREAQAIHKLYGGEG